MKFKKLRQYKTAGSGDKWELSFPLPRTPEGRVYRFSPNEAAFPRHFVLGEIIPNWIITESQKTHMKLEPHSSQTVCPYSGTIADDDVFNHPDDIEAAFEMMKHAIISDTAESLNSSIQKLATSTSRYKYVKITTKSARIPQPAPRFSRDDLLRVLVCDHCGRDYGVFAIGLFCPDCGAPNLSLHFSREVQLVTSQVQASDAQKIENKELSYRLLGNAHEDVLTAFEATLKTVYIFGSHSLALEPIKPIKNDFQNMESASQRFAELKVLPFAALNELEKATLKLNIQKRHIIGHNLGIMDSKFSEHSVDARIGETVEIVGEDILQFAAIAQKVVNQLDAWLESIALIPFTSTGDHSDLSDEF